MDKWITAIAVSSQPDLNFDPIPPSSTTFTNRYRPEFDLGNRLLARNRDTFIQSLIFARLARIPLVLVGAFLLWKITSPWNPHSRLLIQLFWCSSPLLLGHGWVVSADGLCGVAMVFILWRTMALWREPSWRQFALTGLAWGLALGSKFTFGPLYLVYPFMVHLSVPMGWVSTMIRKTHPDNPQTINRDSEIRQSLRSKILFVAPRWLLHALVACVTVNAIYLFQETGWTLGKHDFISNATSFIRETNEEDSWARQGAIGLIRNLPSPFPRSFLEGVDQQMADMDSPRGAYLLGSRIPGAIHWYFIVGYFMKEQLAVWITIGLRIALLVLTRFRQPNAISNTKKQAASCYRSEIIWFSFLYIVYFGCFMATQANLVWNVRYLIPCLPLIYLCACAGLDCLRGLRCAAVHALLISMIAAEFIGNYAFHYSYVNPLFGGARRIPIALNDSNFDYGQDLFFISSWLRDQQRLRPEEKQEVYGVLSGHGRAWFTESLQVPSEALLEEFLRARKETGTAYDKHSSTSRSVKILIVSRGLFHPEPWAEQDSTLRDHALSAEFRTKLRILLNASPDDWITPVVVVYRIHP